MTSTLLTPLSSILSIVVISSLSSCKVTDVTDEEQSASLVAYSDDGVAGAEINKQFSRRTATLFSTDALERNAGTGESSSGNSGTQDVSASIQLDPGKHLAFGTAIPIDPRGYFLTAGHCLDGRETYAMYTNTDHETVIQKVRPVWVRISSLPEIDLALFHVEGEPFGTFNWAGSFEIGETVFSAGTTVKVNGEEDPPFQTSIDSFAGEVKKARDISFQKTTFQLIWHRSPVRSGNSGGPLVNRKGELIGVNYASSNPIQRATGAEMTPMGYAMRPNRDWMQDLIAKDWAKRQGQ
ncbi:MAG: serine protease [Verrucomicrobiales bacterium]|nr:serine protease [Verrucomicrobiales bacterium]